MEIANNSIVSMSSHRSSQLSVGIDNESSQRQAVKHNHGHEKDHGMQQSGHHRSRYMRMSSRQAHEGHGVNAMNRDHGMHRGFRSGHHHGHHGFHQQQGLGMGAFQQEVKISLSRSFSENQMSSQMTYHSVTKSTEEGDTPKQIATETLMTAKRIMRADPEAGSKSLITFRQKIETAAISAKEAVSTENDIAEIDETMAIVNEGLDELDVEAAKEMGSSASVLAIEHKERQGTSIRIRTQEGDIVKLSLRQATHLSASDVAVQGENSTASLTSIELSGHGGLRLSIEGDLNENELEAIKNVFAKAEAIADEFFEGDIAAAFNLAEDFEFDSDQLARVKLGFRSEQVTTVSYTEIGTSTPVIPEEDDTATLPVDGGVNAGQEPVSSNQEQTVRANTSSQVQTNDSNEQEAVINENTESGTTGVEAASSNNASANNEQNVNNPTTPNGLNNSAFEGFFNLISSFSRATTSGFDSSASEGGSATLRYHYSESFKLDILKSVLKTTAPSELDEAANVATLIIDSVAKDDGGVMSDVDTA